MRKFLLLAVSVFPLSAQIEKTLQALYAVKDFHETAISPDGMRLTYTEALRAKGGAESDNKAIWLVNLTSPNSQPKRITAGGQKTCSEKGAAWSRDGKLAFLSNCLTGKQAQVFTASAEGGDVHKLTDVTGFLQSVKWSPDGRSVAFLFTENAIRMAGAVEATAPDAGVVEEKFYEQRVAVVDLPGGKIRQITPADTYVYEFDWSPDSKRIAYTAAKGSGDNNWWTAELFAVTVASGEVRQVYKPTLQIAVPRWSPDGRTIAFVGGIMSDQGSTGGDVYTVPAAGGEATNLTPGRKTSPAWIHWRNNGQLMMTERVDGGSAVTLLSLTNGAVETLWKEDESIRSGGDDLSLSVAADGKTVAAVRTSWTQAPEVWAGTLGDWKPVTKANHAAKPLWGEAHNLHWDVAGRRVQGWLLYPRNFNAGERYPLVVSIHGGPASGKSPSWPNPGFDLTMLSAEGYFVLFPNPRGSYGGGEEFTAANVKDFGHGDLEDVLGGVDEVLRTLPVDEKRIGVGGWSYGGFMTMWTVTQTNRFHAAVAGAGIANWQSYYGQNSIDEWMLPYFGASVYDDPAVYAKSSPITYIKNAKTPTLIVVGDRDGECPAPQSYEFWHALKAQGVPTRFIVYPGEGHHFRDPKHIEDLAKQTVAWFNERLK